ncbi:Appr-1-p processing domain protein [Thermanaerovibrio acidaminovorans DSM 6589]|uniref:Appr-1-p processing domain protein n=1 Tax=Thermanaerovibrio acidaminovorans (strain ATCC 49978 / DSM 6589 / Su883) TaxID=525903 RepID=D1B7G8_THEAS|nr:macro domain-containing protein [Thermanaerovibrio acidaminovorans]ACZ19959.1 Appr-1-p processing domain protein [Thermanaerovibrio acidaminovorans DSM 6589]
MEREMRICGTWVIFREGDICSYRGDAIVNAANDRLWMGSGVAGAIRRSAGEEVEAEAISKGPIRVGSAVATGAGRLPLKAVIHCAVMGQDLKTSREAIRSSTGEALRLAAEMELRRIAFPALGTGVGGFPVEECGHVMGEELKEFLLICPDGLDEVAFYLFGAEAFRQFVRGATRALES